MQQCKPLQRRAEDFNPAAPSVQPRERRKNQCFDPSNSPNRRLADKVLPLIVVTMARYVEGKQKRDETRFKKAMEAMDDVVKQHPKLSLEQQQNLAYECADAMLDKNRKLQ